MQLFQNATTHYLAMAGNDFGKVDELQAVPESVRLVWRLSLFLNEVASGGVLDYLWNYCHRLADIQEAHAALKTIGAREVLDLVETGIRISADECCGEFLEDVGAMEWAQKFDRKSNLDATALNLRTMDVAYALASESVAEFIRKHRAEF